MQALPPRVAIQLPRLPAMQTTSATYRQITKNLDRTLTATSASKPVALETANYLKNIGNIKSIDAFIANTRVFTYAMNAFGLGDMAHAKAFMRKVLTEGIDDPKAFAHRLADDRFVNFARAFDFKNKGTDTTSSVDAQQGVVDRYVRQTLENTAGEDDQGVRLALYFQRTAPTVKSAFGLLADPALWQVMKTVYGFPDAMANASIDNQAAAVNARLNVADLQDPAKLAKLISRFTAVWDVTENAPADPRLALFGVGSKTSLDLNLVMTLKSLKYGGA